MMRRVLLGGVATLLLALAACAAPVNTEPTASEPVIEESAVDEPAAESAAPAAEAQNGVATEQAAAAHAAATQVAEIQAASRATSEAGAAAVDETDWLTVNGRTEDGLAYLGNPDAPVTMIEYSDFL